MTHVFPSLERTPDLNRGEQRLAAEVVLADLRREGVPTDTFRRAIRILKVMADKGKADSIAKVASQINLSLSCEVNATIQLKKMGEGHPIAGSMVPTRVNEVEQLPALPKADDTDEYLQKARTDLIWCDQCDMRVTPDQATGCKSKHCKAKA